MKGERGWYTELQDIFSESNMTRRLLQPSPAVDPIQMNMLASPAVIVADIPLAAANLTRA